MLGSFGSCARQMSVSVNRQKARTSDIHNIWIPIISSMMGSKANSEQIFAYIPSFKWCGWEVSAVNVNLDTHSCVSVGGNGTSFYCPGNISPEENAIITM